MNLHPILVHFPIALLSIYAVLELLRFNKLQSLSGWLYARGYTVIVGTLAAYGAYISGNEEGGGLITDPVGRKVFELHEAWAVITLVIFTIIAIHYFIELLRRNSKMASLFFGSQWRIQLGKFLLKLSAAIGKPFIMVTLAIFGLCAITITGGLGGSMIYGPDVDPIVSLIYKVFVLR